MERCRNADFDALGITSSQASVMMFLFKNRKHEVTQQSVQAALLLSHPTITGLMKRLEAKGFITRKNSPADFRCKYVKLTKKGCDIERGLKTNMKRMQDRALVGLSQEELDNLEKSLCVIAENLRKEEDMLAAERIIQDIKERTKEEEKEEKSIVPENIAIKFRDFVKKNPKQIFIGMIALTIISIFGNLIYYYYVVKPSEANYQTVNEQLFDNSARKNAGNGSGSLLTEARNYVEMKKDLDRLKEFQNKKVLSKSDSLEIKKLVKKYNLQ